jgi:hypothetical protein
MNEVPLSSRMCPSKDRGTSKLTRTVLRQANAYAMIRRRAAAAGIVTKLGNHSFRATGITAYLKNGGTLEKAAAMANPTSRLSAHLIMRRGKTATIRMGIRGRGIGMIVVARVSRKGD